tara:strand:+ start:65 stop:523 length:459 start_codon:yes stop_codon:yes gene_type:complete
MLKKKILITLLLFLLNHCEYKPIYSNQSDYNFNIFIENFTGDKNINNLIAKNLRKNNKKKSNETINISFETKYTKDALAKNSAGTITDYQINVSTTFTIQKNNKSEKFEVFEKFSFKKMTDKYEEKNYEQNINRNLASSISQKLILRLTSRK